MQIVGIALVSLLALGASDLCADDPATTTPRRQYQAVLDDFVAAKRAFASKFESATTEEQRRELRAQFPGPDDYYGRLLALAQAHPGDAAAVDSLVWIVATSTNGYDAFKERGVRIKQAMDILAGDHSDDPRVGSVCLELTTAATPLRDEFLHTIHAKSTDRRNKGRVCLALGEFLLAKSETVSRLKGRPFALLSVNTDHDQETLWRSISLGEITWRCWWEAGVDGPICSRWMIEGFPRVYVLDHKGVIRSREFPDKAASNRVIEELLQACEAEDWTSK
jgi:hypothetical protein